MADLAKDTFYRASAKVEIGADMTLTPVEPEAG